MHEVKMPQLGQTVEEASVVQWLKKEGDAVQVGEPLCTVQTDKAEIEVESPVAGTVRRILVGPDVPVPVLSVIALVGEPEEPLPDLGQRPGRSPAEAVKTAAPPEEWAAATDPAAVPSAAAGGRVAISPRARIRANELDVDAAAAVGSGPSGRIIEADVLALAGAKKVKITPTAQRLAATKGVDAARLKGTGPGGKVMKGDVEKAAAAPVGAPAPAPAAALPTEDRRIPLTPMRTIIAKRMSQSKHAAPHYYITVEADLSAAIERFRSGGLSFKPSYNDLVLAAVVKTLREFPGVNASWAGDAIIQKADINLGVAVALPAGLIVPVLKKAQALSLEDIHRAVRELAEKARTSKLLPDDYAGNTFTVTNLGTYGVDHFTAIINQSDSAILAIGQLKDRPMVVDGEIHIRPIMKLTLSSDHRVIDGAVAAQFMGRLKEILETADL